MKQEFRKIPSLDFRYEVSRDGVVRNIKSKKVKKQFITRFGYYGTSYAVNKSNPHYRKGQGWERPLNDLIKECWGQKNSQRKKRVPVVLINIKTREKFEFKSRFAAAEWLIQTKQTQTQNPCGLARRIAIQKFVHGYEIHNINAERPAEKA